MRNREYECIFGLSMIRAHFQFKCCSGNSFARLTKNVVTVFNGFGVPLFLSPGPSVINRFIVAQSARSVGSLEPKFLAC
jgi:hypothetical protein